MIAGRENMRYDGVGGTLAARGRWQLSMSATVGNDYKELYL
jgi:hypothetical protein